MIGLIPREYVAAAAFGLMSLFLALGVTIMIPTARSPRFTARVFYALAVLMFVFYLTAVQLPTASVQSSGTLIQVGTWVVDTTAQWLVGVGTLALAGITFYVSVGKPWRLRPRLAIEFEQDNPFCRTVLAYSEDDGSLSNTYWLRLRVRNQGRTPAKGCIVKLVEVKRDGEVDWDYDPVQLHWVGTKHDVVPLPTIQLNPKDYEYVDVLTTRSKNPGFATICRDYLRRGIPCVIPAGAFLLRIAASAENAEPVEVNLEVHLGASNYEDLSVSEVTAS